MHLRLGFPGDAALVITEVRPNDTGHYRCEVVDGLEDRSVSVELELLGGWWGGGDEGWREGSESL